MTPTEFIKAAGIASELQPWQRSLLDSMERGDIFVSGRRCGKQVLTLAALRRARAALLDGQVGNFHGFNYFYHVRVRSKRRVGRKFYRVTRYVRKVQPA